MSVVQPDLNYNGGFTGAARVARMGPQAQPVDLPAQHPDRLRIREYPIRRVHFEYRPLHGRPGPGVDPEYLKKAEVLKA